jgi:hypothetical protein
LVSKVLLRDSHAPKLEKPRAGMYGAPGRLRREPISKKPLPQLKASAFE